MGIGYDEMINTPNWVINQDLEVVNIENQYGKAPKEEEKK